MAKRVRLPNGQIINFPDDMSIEDINKYTRQHIDQNPDAAIPRDGPPQLGSPANLRESPYGGSGDIARNARTNWENMGVQRRVTARLQSAARGLPIVRNFPTLTGTGNPDIDTDFAAQPNEAAISRGVLSTLPFGVAGRVGAALPFGRQLATQSGIGAILGGADAVTNPNNRGGDIAAGTALGGLFGAAGPIASRMLSPVNRDIVTARHNIQNARVDGTAEFNPRAMENYTRVVNDALPWPLPQSAAYLARSADNDNFTLGIIRALAGGYVHPAAGVAAAIAPMTGRVAHKIITNAPEVADPSRYGYRFANRLFENQLFNDPNRRAIINALTQQAPTMGDRWNDVQIPTLSGQ